MTIISTTYGDPRLREEFWVKVREDPGTKCWVWVGKISRGGSAMHGAKIAWKWAYEQLVGMCPQGATGRRMCNTKACVNPEHRIVTLPRSCPTCGHDFERPEGTPKVFRMENGRVQIDPDDRVDGVVWDSPRMSVGELMNLKPPKNDVDPTPDPNMVDYRSGELRLTMRVYESSTPQYELSDGTWTTENEMTEAQRSHLIGEIDDTGFFTDAWTKVTWKEKTGRQSGKRSRRR